MKRYILTGTPGSGKTSILQALKNQGYAVVEEAGADCWGLLAVALSAVPLPIPRGLIPWGKRSRQPEYQGKEGK